MDGSYSNSSSLLDDVNANAQVQSDHTLSDNDIAHKPRVDAVNAQSVEVNAVNHNEDPSPSSIPIEGSGRIVGNDSDNAEFDLMFNDELYNFFDDESSGSRDFSFDLEYLSAGPLQKQQAGTPELYPPSQPAVSNAASSFPSVIPLVPKAAQPAPPTAEAKEGALIWHNATTDKQHRESMIILIANLLKARKKVPPSSEWQQQLPHKAKKLERRLYYSAPSLAAYIDRTTIKLRLQALAREIVSQHQDSRNFENAVASFPPPSSSFRASSQHRPSARTSAASNASSASLTSALTKHRSSFISHASIDSLRDLRDSVDSKIVIDNTSELSKTMTKGVKDRSGSASSKRSTGGDSADGPDKKRRQSAASSRPLPPSQNPIVKMSSESVSELERQKAVNARLQEQIMENIRLQEELVRKLQADQGISNRSSSFTNEPQPQLFSAPSSGNAPASQYGNLFGNASTNTSALMSSDKSMSNGITTNPMLSSSNSGVMIPQQPLMNQGVGNSLPYQQTQFSSTDVNSFLMNSGVLGGLQQPQQPQSSQSFPNMQQVSALQNQFFLQQQQPAASMAPLGTGGNGQFQQLQYGMMQQPQLSNLSNFSNVSRAMIGMTGGMNLNAAASNSITSLPMANLRNNSQMATQPGLMNNVPNVTGIQQQPYNLSSSFNTNYVPTAPGSGNAQVILPPGNETRPVQPPQQQPSSNNGTADNFLWWK